jgi:hypothetical protein
VFRGHHADADSDLKRALIGYFAASEGFTALTYSSIFESL